jgi:hypothetical protein
MLFVDLLVALLVGIVLTIVFAALFRNTGPWGAWWAFLLIVVLATWAGGLWITPFGPPIWGYTWLPFLLVGVFFALLIAAATPVPRRPLNRVERGKAQEAAAETATALGIFFWVLIVGLGIAIVLAYAI